MPPDNARKALLLTLIAVAAALPLRGLPAWRVCLGLPLLGRPQPKRSRRGRMTKVSVPGGFATNDDGGVRG